MEHSLGMEISESFGRVQGNRHPDEPRQLLIFLLDQLLKTSAIDVLKIKYNLKKSYFEECLVQIS